MEATKNLGVTWQCTCGKWNNGQRTTCWSCGATYTSKVLAAKHQQLDAELARIGPQATKAEIAAVQAKYAAPRRGRPRKGA
jgi:hypothetical protein